jgi:LemA protein
MTLYIILAIVVVVVLWIIATFNRFATLRMRVREAWSDIDVQLKRRSDLIPNLVETVKGYMAHEREVLENVTNARTALMSAQGAGGKAQAENQLAGALKTLFAVAENYPQLRASENFQKLQDELSDTENKIQAARRFYNSNVQDLNTTLARFPSNIIGNMFGVKEAEFFAVATDAERQNVQVKF